MNAIAVVTIMMNNQKHRIVTNLTATHQQVIAYFGPYALEIYGCSTELIPAAAFTYKPRPIDNDKNRLTWCEM